MEKFKKFIYDWVLPFITALIIFLIINIFVGVNRVSGSSMYPTYHDGEFAVINKLFYTEPAKGDVIIFNSILKNTESIFGGNKRLIKRIIAVPGDHIVIKGGNVYINDLKLDEPYLEHGLATSGDVDLIIGEDQYFVLGDNRGNSADSRSIGTISKDSIIGKVVLTFL